MTYAEAMDKYGVDKPDLRFDLELCDVTERGARRCGFRDVRERDRAGGGIVKCLRVPGPADKLPRSMLDGLNDFAKSFGAKAAWAQGPGGRRVAGAVRKSVHRRGARRDQPHRRRRARRHADLRRRQGQGREHDARRDPPPHIGEKLGLIRKGEWQFMWLADPPLFEIDDGRGRGGAPPVHVAARRGRGPARDATGQGARARLRPRAQRRRGRRRLDPYPSQRAAGPRVQGARHLRGGQPREVRLPARRVQVRPAAARRHRVRPRPPGDADDGRRIAARRDRVPEDAEGLGPHDRVPDAGSEEAARRAVHPAEARPAAEAVTGFV